MVRGWIVFASYGIVLLGKNSFLAFHVAVGVVVVGVVVVPFLLSWFLYIAI